MNRGLKEKDFSGIKCFALDMDGTFYLGNRLLDGSMDFLRRVCETGRKYVFLTNNSSKSMGEYIEKLAGMGLDITKKELVSSGQATIEYLQAHHPGKSVYLLGNPTLAAEFSDAGIQLQTDDPDMLVTAFDTTLNYEKLCKVCDLVRAGIPYIATHPDFNCPTETGFVPDIGAVHAFVNASVGRMPDKVIGKPYREIIDCALRQTGCTADQTAMVGDRLYTDIAVTANVPGLTGILVLSGETKPADLAGAEVQPHMIFDSLKDITPLL
ncbi:MAG: HAD-IIA family hydrolase [Oscillospiraceae bacterium]|nr:HAD-IIA family hydrolase [Oscillospiraceae bacterium]